MSNELIIWKMLLRRDCRIDGLPVAYDLCCIDGGNFKQVYRELQTETMSAAEWMQIALDIVSKTHTAALVWKALPYVKKAVLKGDLCQMLSLVDNYSYCYSGFEEKNPEWLKISETVLHLIINYIQSNKDLDTKHKFDYCFLGWAYAQVHVDHTKSLWCLERGMSLKNSKCFVQAFQTLVLEPCEILRLCNAAIKLFPDQKYLALYHLAVLKSKTSIEDAIWIMQDSLEECDKLVVPMRSERNVILHKLGKWHQTLKKYAQAVDFFKLEIESIEVTELKTISYKNIDVYLRLAAILVCNLPNLALEAEILLRRLATLFELTDEQKLYRAEIVVDICIRMKSWEMLEKEVQIVAFSSEVHSYNCVLQYQQGNYEKGIQAGLAGFVSGLRVNRYLARCYRKLKRYEECYHSLQEYKLKSDNYIVWLEFAMLHLEKESSFYDLPKAQELLHKARACKNEDIPADFEASLMEVEQQIAVIKKF